MIAFRNELRQWRYKHSASRTELQSLIGKLVHASKVVRYGRSFYQNLLSILRNNNRNNYNSIEINQYALFDINWWYHYISVWNGTSMIPPSIDTYKYTDQYLLFTDASSIWYGCIFQ